MKNNEKMAYCVTSYCVYVSSVLFPVSYPQYSLMRRKYWISAVTNA